MMKFVPLFAALAVGSVIDFPPDSTPRIPVELFGDAEAFVTPVRVRGDELGTSLLHKFKSITVNKRRILVGYGVNRTTFLANPNEEPVTKEWSPDFDRVQECLSNGLTQELCQNHITLVEETKSNNLLVCGTNAGSPMCRFYDVRYGNGRLEVAEVEGSIEDGSTIISPSAEWTMDSIYDARSKHMYVAKEMGNHRGQIERFSFSSKSKDFLQLAENAFSAYGPVKIVKLLEHEEHVFLFFRERLRNGTDLSRVATICKNDLGGSQNILSNKFTSFVKTTLNCPVSPEFSFR